MKRLLSLVLLVLGLAAVASAPVPHKEEVLIYSFTEKSTDYTCDINGITDMNLVNSLDWVKSNKTETGYLIVQWNSPISLNVWTIRMEKGNKLLGRDGKMHQGVTFEGPAEYSIAKADIGKKTTWLVGSAYEDQHILLTGDEKPIKILDNEGDAATKLAGTRTWYYEYDKVLHVGSSVISLRWHSKFTAEYFSDPDLFDAEDATDWLLYYLESKGYIIIPSPI